MNEILGVNKYWGDLDKSYIEYKLPNETKYEYLTRLTNYSVEDNKSDIEYIKSIILDSLNNVDDPNSIMDVYTNLISKLDLASDFLENFRIVNIDNLEKSLINTDKSIKTAIVKKFDINSLEMKPLKFGDYTEMSVSCSELVNHFGSFVSIYTSTEFNKPILIKSSNPVELYFALGRVNHVNDLVNSNDCKLKEELLSLVIDLQKNKMLKLQSVYVPNNSVSINEDILTVEMEDIKMITSLDKVNKVMDNIYAFDYNLNGVIWTVYFRHESIH